MKIEKYKSKLNEYKGERKSWERMLTSEQKDLDKYSSDLIDAELAAEIIYHISKKTQEGLSFRIEKLVTTALEYVLDNPYKFKVKFGVSNSRTQCNLLYERDGFEIDPLKDGEGGGADVASSALHLAVWSLVDPADRTSPVFVLDENFKHVSKDMKGKATMFLQEMCRELGVQILTVSHDDSTIEGADKLFKMKMDDNNRSRIEEEVVT